MKNYLSILFLLLFSLSSTTAQTDRTLKNGFGVKLNISSPGSNYGLASPTLTDINGQSIGSIDFGSGFMIGVQVGNVWYFNPKEKFGIGLMVNWMDFTIAFASGNNLVTNGFETNTNKLTFDFTIAEIGPIATFKLNDNSAFDVYYNLRPSIYFSTILTNDSFNSFNQDILSIAFGPTHAIGAAFRYKVFYVGPELVIGRLKDRKVRNADFFDEYLYDDDIKATHFRIVVGAKF